MSTASPSNVGSALAALRHSCARRSMAEIELETSTGELLCARMRLLACDERRLYIDRPLLGGIPLELTTDMFATIYFLHQGERYAVRSRIDEETRVPIGGGQAVPGFALPLPEQVLRQERRVDCRASLARCGEVVGRFEPVDAAAGGGAFCGQLMNISAGGINTIVLDPNGNPLKVGDGLIVRFELPRLQRSFELRTEIRHCRRLDSGGCILGLKYLADEAVTEMRHAIRRISQFVAKQLKRGAKPS